MATSYKNKTYTTLGTPTNITTAITPLSVSNSSGIPVKDYTVKGKSIVWNQLVKNGNFVDATGWSTYNGTGSVSNNKYTFTVSGTQTYANVSQVMDKSVFVAGHKYYVTATITPQYSAGKVAVALHNGATIQENLWTANASSGKTNFVSTTFTISSNFVSGATTSTRLIFYCPQTESVKGNITVISNAWMVDLTKMFGAGNEPTSAQFRALFPEDYYEYDEGTIKSIVGDLQLQSSLPERYQLADFRTLYGVDTDYHISANFKPSDSVIAGNRYFFYADVVNAEGSSTLGIWWRNANNEAVRWCNRGDISAAPANLVGGGTTQQNFWLYGSRALSATNIMLFNLTAMFGAGNEPATPAEFWQKVTKKYYSYNPNAYKSINIPVETYFPDGMKSAGVDYDEISFSAQTATKRVQTIDLGTVKWVYISNYQGSPAFRTEAALPGVITGFDWRVQHVCCSKYSFDSSVFTTTPKDKTCGLSSAGQIFVRDSSYSDAATFKAAMSGVMFNYTLSTPTITNIPKKLQALPTYKGFTSFSFPNNVMQNGPFDLTYYAEGGANPEKGWITTYKRKIYTGKTVEWNQLRTDNGSSGSVTVTSQRRQIGVENTSLVFGHKYLVSFLARYTDGNTNTGSVRFKMGHPNYSEFSFLFNPTTDPALYQTIGTLQAEAPTQIHRSYFLKITSNTEVLAFEWKDLQIFDLTQMFGAGNEPTTPTEFWQYFDNKYYPYNTGETQPLFLQSRKAVTQYTITNTQNRFIFDIPDGAKSATILGWGGQSKVINGVLYDGGLVSVRIDGKNLITPARDSFTVTSSDGDAVIASGETMKNIAKNSTTKRNSSYLKIDTVDAVFNPSSKNRVGMESSYSVSGELKYSPSVWITGTSFLSGTNNDVQSYRTTVYSSDYEEASTYNSLICYVQGLTSGTVTTKDFEIRENKSYNTIPTDIQSLTGYGMGIGDLYNSVERHESGWHYVQRVGNIKLTQELLDSASETGTATIDGKTVVWARNIQFPDSGVSRSYNGVNGWANISVLGDIVFNGTKYNSTQYRMYFMNYSSIEDVKTALGTDGVAFHYQIATPVTTDISDKIDSSFLKDIPVVSGGKLVMYNKYLLDVPSTVKWKY